SRKERAGRGLCALRARIRFGDAYRRPQNGSASTRIRLCSAPFRPAMAGCLSTLQAESIVGFAAEAERLRGEAWPWLRSQPALRRFGASTDRIPITCLGVAGKTNRARRRTVW